MDSLWTWGGESFGYRRDDRLFTYYGRQVGRFYDDEVYGADGRYLGEVKSKNRLVTNISKKGRSKSGFTATIGSSLARNANYPSFPMYAGYEDFPSPDDFR